MADYKLLVPKIKRWEAGWANDPDDLGGCTMSGCTLNTYRSFYGQDKTCEDLRKMTEKEWDNIFKSGFWNKCKGDDIKNQSVAELLVDFAYMSGVRTAVKAIQKIVGSTQDGVMGPITIGMINRSNQMLLFYKLWTYRHDYFYKIVERRPVSGKFLNGWIKRLSSYHFL